jgi:hypothetical protein
MGAVIIVKRLSPDIKFCLSSFTVSPGFYFSC